VSDQTRGGGPDHEASSDDDVTYRLDDDEGHEHEYALLAIVEFEGNDYALLARADQLSDADAPDAEKTEIRVFAYRRDGDDEVFDVIGDEALYERVVEFCEMALSEDPEGDEG